MAKNKMVNVVNDLMVDLSPENFIVKEGKGKKAKVNEAATAMAMLTNISYYRGLFDAFDAVSDNVEGLDEATADHKKAFDTLFAHATENYEDVATALADASIEAFGGDDDEDAEDPTAMIAEMDRDDAKAVAKALGVKVVKSDTSETLAEKIAEEAEEEDIINTLTELGYYGDAESEDEEDDDEEPEEEEAEDEAPEYANMSLGELRKLCKSEGIRYTPKEKAEDLVAKLDEFYAEESDEEEEEPEDEGEDETEEMDYSEMSLSDLRAECKERGIKYTPKDKSDALIAKLEADDAENGSDDEEPEEEAEDESNGYSEMSLGELRKECKARGIKYTPKDKEDALIAKLEEDDGAGSDDDEEEAAEEGDDVDEKELDEILDEEFEDEVLEQEKKAAGKSGKKGGKKR